MNLMLFLACCNILLNKNFILWSIFFHSAVAEVRIEKRDVINDNDHHDHHHQKRNPLTKILIIILFLSLLVNYGYFMRYYAT